MRGTADFSLPFRGIRLQNFSADRDERHGFGCFLFLWQAQDGWEPSSVIRLPSAHLMTSKSAHARFTVHGHTESPPCSRLVSPTKKAGIAPASLRSTLFCSPLHIRRDFKFHFFDRHPRRVFYFFLDEAANTMDRFAKFLRAGSTNRKG